MDKTFTWYSNDTVFTKSEMTFPGGTQVSFKYSPTSADFTKNADALDLKVVGILSPKDTISYGSLSTGIYYTEALTDHILASSAETEIAKYIAEKGDITSMMYGTMPIGISYTYSYSYGGETYNDGLAFVGSQLGMSDIMSGMSGMGSSSGSTGGSTGGGMNMSTLSARRVLSLRSVGGNNIANSVSIYPVNFESKDLVTNYLDAWNDDHVDITYMDTLSLVIDLINNMIDIVSYALIAFTSISLVVSTVMIGIITYVSVVERIKEIGVIRSLGGRKKDVSHLFNAETFILGLLAGLFGVGVTYGISLIVNIILKPLIGYATIAALPVSQAVMLVILSIGLTLISGLIPASSAAKRDPVVALRTE